ncbi:MAG: hypothetical protein AAFY60_15040, partial [Myxococcota bacterium]
LSAAITWFDSPLGGQCKAGESLLSATQSTDVTRDARYHAPRSSRDGSLENHAFELLELVRPGLARELALFHPQIATTAQLNATADFARECRAEFGAFLANFNVFTCMHVMGRTPGLLKILTTELGLAPESYLGYSVAYSDSAVSRARSAIEGYDTRAYPKSTPAYTDRCKAALRAGLEEMASRSNENGKPMLIVDDTGYAAEVATELGIADRCKIVGWTKRTSWLFDAEESPRCAFVRGGESAPKTQWEPPLLAGGMADYVRCALNESFQQPDRAVVGIVGQGDIGAHLAAELGRRGHRVAVHDQDVAQCFRVRQHNVHNEADATAFTRTVDLFAGTTGAGGLRSEHMRHAKPDAVKMSFSSANTEEGTLELSPDSWLNDGHSVKIQLGGQSTASRSRRVSAAGQEVWERGFRDSLSKSFGSGMGVEIGFSTSVRSSFVGNLAGRCRETELEAEELILMNVIRSMAEVSVLDAPRPGH